MNNRERISEALDILNHALRPYVQKQLETTYSGRWVAEVENSFRESSNRKQSLSDPSNWDTHVILAIMWNHWNGVFGRSLGKIERNYIGELQEVRNKWAHQGSFDNENAFRALGTMEKLLDAVSAKQVSDIGRLKAEVLRLMTKDTEKAVRPPPNDKPRVSGAPSYHVYVNTRRPPGVAMIHYSTCSFANHGEGTQGKPSNFKSYWSPRLVSYADAEIYSRKARTDIKIRPCKACHPS